MDRVDRANDRVKNVIDGLLSKLESTAGLSGGEVDPGGGDFEGDI